MKPAPHFIARYLAAILSAFVLLAVAIAVLLGVRDWAGIASVAGVAFSFIYFYQSQHLEQTRLLKDLVTDFNARYDRLNDALNLIVEKGSLKGEYEGRPLHIYLNDYFNLCAEEYLFFKRGYVPTEVWNSWLNGMRHFYHSSDPIASRWKTELGSDSHYGFPLSMLASKRAA